MLGFTDEPIDVIAYVTKRSLVTILWHITVCI